MKVVQFSVQFDARHSSVRFHWLLILASVLGLLGSPAKGDVFHLRSGGRVTGKLLNPEQDPRTMYVIRLDTGGDVSIDVNDVRDIDTMSPKQRKYYDVLQKMPADTAENHWTMAQWCKRQLMVPERTFHLEQTIRHDPDHEEARRALKYQRQEDGSWARKDDLWAADGYVRSRGGWRTPQQDRIAKQSQLREDTRLKWQRDLKMWKGWLRGDRREEALKNIFSIDDPLAAEPLTKMFATARNSQLQEQLAEILARLDSSVATEALIQAAMNAKDYELRLRCARLLRKHHRRQAAQYFVSQLASKDNSRINRAAAALKIVGDDSTILPLIQALRTEHRVRVVRNPNRINAAFSRDGRGGGGLSMGNSSKSMDVMKDNKQVRNALIALTDVDYEFRQHEWKRWYTSRTTPPNLDLRRDL